MMANSETSWHKGLEIHIAVGSIADAEADAIINAANTGGWLGSGVAGAIKAAGGVEIETEATGKAPIPVGGAIVTGAGRLKAQWVIHAVAIDENLHGSPELIRQATLSALDCAEELGATIVALPALGAGVGGVPMQSVADAMKQGIIEFLRDRKTEAVTVLRIVLYDVLAFNTFRHVFWGLK